MNYQPKKEGVDEPAISPDFTNVEMLEDIHFFHVPIKPMPVSIVVTYAPKTLRHK